MKVLVVYATSEGQTRKIARSVASLLKDDGHDAVAHDSATSLGNLNPQSCDAVIVAASVHDGVHQETIIDFVTARRAALESVPSAFLSVSLSAALEGGEAETRGYIDRFIEDTEWQPLEALPVAGALLYSEYDYFRKQIIKDVVFRQNFRIDAERDYEFTDWDKLRDFVRAFVAKAAAMAQSPAAS